MTRNDIIRVMRELIGPESEGWVVNEAILEDWMPFFQAIAAAEREACAQIVDEYAWQTWDMVVAEKCAAAIRARSNHE